MHNLENITLKEWRFLTGKEGPLIYAACTINLRSAVQIIGKNRLHRLPIIDDKENRILGIINIGEVFTFFYDNFIGQE